MAAKLPQNIARFGKKFWVQKMTRGQRFRKGFDSLPDAIECLRDLEIRAVKGQAQRETQRVTCNVWIDECLEWAEIEKARSTYGNYRYALENLRSFLVREGVDYVAQIDISVLERHKGQRLRTRSRRTNESISAGTVANELKLISCVLSRAVRLGYIQENPCSSVQRPKQSERAPRFFSEAEIVALLASALPHDRPLYALMYYTGLRPGEALHLKWDDFLWDQGVILVREKDGWVPKGRRPRSVPIHPDLIPYLRELAVLSEWVFAHPDGRRRRYSGVKANFSRRRDRLGIQDAGLHTWRHTFATHFVQTTGDIRAAQEILGHRDIRQTMRYAHTTPEHLSNTLQRLPTLGDMRAKLTKKLTKESSGEFGGVPEPLSAKGFKAVGAAGIEPATSTV